MFAIALIFKTIWFDTLTHTHTHPFLRFLKIKTPLSLSGWDIRKLPGSQLISPIGLDGLSRVAVGEGSHVATGNNKLIKQKNILSPQPKT